MGDLLAHSVPQDKLDQEENQAYLDCQAQTALPEILGFPARLAKREIKDPKDTRGRSDFPVQEVLKETKAKEAHLVKLALKEKGVMRVSKAIWVKKAPVEILVPSENQALKALKVRKEVKAQEVKQVLLAPLAIKEK